MLLCAEQSLELQKNERKESKERGRCLVFQEKEEDGLAWGADSQADENRWVWATLW